MNSIKGYEGRYTIDRNGNIYSFKSKRLLKAVKDKDGYLIIRLNKNGICKSYKLHRLLALQYIPNPNSYPYINHIDGKVDNNSLDNLEWCTPKQNAVHAVKIGLIDYTYASWCKPVKQIGKDFIKTYTSMTLASKATGVNKGSIWKAINKYGHSKTAGGFEWEYAGRKCDHCQKEEEQ